MTKVLCGKQMLPTNEQQALEYSILVDEVSFMSGQMLCECYGVQIDLEEESAEVRYITTNQNAISDLIDWLRLGFVTPRALREVVDDWLLNGAAE